LWSEDEAREIIESEHEDVSDYERQAGNFIVARQNAHKIH
jgi:hypothetical protein